MLSGNKKQNLQTKLILTGLLVAVCLAAIGGGFFLFSGNSNRSFASAEGTYKVWPTVAVVKESKEKPATVPAKTAVAAAITPQATPDEDDAHSIDPETEKSIKMLLASSSPELNNFKSLPLPTQYQAGRYTPFGAPTISLPVFQYFLKQSNSPAYPEAASIYNACLRMACDPAVALAFFQHESSMGTQGAAAENKSWGNIRCTPGFNCRATSGNGSFRSYATWTEGLIDWAILLRETYAVKWKLYTLEEIIPRYAPSSDNNNPNGYINTVKKLADKYRSFKLAGS